MADESITSFLECLIKDEYEKKILRLIAKNLESEEIIELLLKDEVESHD